MLKERFIKIYYFNLNLTKNALIGKILSFQNEFNSIFKNFMYC